MEHIVARKSTTLAQISVQIDYTKLTALYFRSGKHLLPTKVENWVGVAFQARNVGAERSTKSIHRNLIDCFPFTRIISYNFLTQIVAIVKVSITDYSI